MQIIDYVLTHFIGKPLWWSEPCNAALCFTKLSTATRRDRNDMVWNEKIDDLNSDMHAEIGYLILFAYFLSYANIHGLCYYNAQQSYNDKLTHAHICLHACSRTDSSQHADNQHIE